MVSIWLGSRMRRRKRQMTARVPILGQHHMPKSPGQPVDHRHDLVAARHRKRAARAEIVLDVDHQQHIAIADRKLFRHGCARSCCSRRRSTSRASRAKASAHLNRIGGARFQLAQRLRQALELARRARADVGERRRRRDPTAALHDQLNERLAALPVAVERKDVAGDAAVRPIAAPDLLASRPCRLAGRPLAPGDAGVFLQLVGAVERRHVGRRGQAGADAEAVDRRAGLHDLGDGVLVEPAAGEDVRPPKARRRRGCGARCGTTRSDRRCRAARCRS